MDDYDSFEEWIVGDVEDGLVPPSMLEEFTERLKQEQSEE